MAVFKVVVSEPETRKSYQLEADQSKAAGLIGKKIGDEFNGDLIGLAGYTLKITGGTDKDGFPMHPDIKGSVKKKALLAMPPGFHPKIKGQRKRKTVRGNTISDQITQINVVITKKGEKSLEELVPKKGGEEKKAEEKRPTEEAKTGGEESKGKE